MAIAVLWLGYATGMWGYCLVRGYCVTPADVVSPGFPARAKAAGGGSVTTNPYLNAPAPPGSATLIPPRPGQPGKGVIIPVVPNPQDPGNPSPAQPQPGQVVNV